MKNSIIEKIKIKTNDPEAVRKQKRLSLILVALAIIDIIVMIGILVLVLTGIEIGEQKGVLPIYVTSAIFLVIVVSIFILNNYFSSVLANQIFIGIFIVLLIIADSPKEIIQGRSTYFFYLPIYFAGILLKPLSSFIVAVIISFINIILAILINATPNILAIGTFLIVGFIMWFFAKGLQQSLSYSRAAYNRSNFYKDIFSHDINNILQNILSSSQLLSQYVKDPKREEKFKEVIEILNEEVTRGAYLVSNIRKLSELEDEEISLKLIDALGVLNNVIEAIRKSYQNKKIYIQIRQNTKKMLVLANELLNNVFENVLINAIRHNKNPIIEISIIISIEQVKQIDYFKCEILDNGIGISDEMKEKIFLRSSKSTEHIGGLGLSLVKQIIDKFNGQIWVEDKISGDYTQGSKFVLLIPTNQ